MTEKIKAIHLVYDFTREDSMDQVLDEMNGCPPCIRFLIQQKIKSGQGRTIALRHLGRYYLKKGYSNWATLLMKRNFDCTERPLSFSNFSNVIKNIVMYPGYDCDHDILKGYCDRDKCKKSKFGITS